MANGRGAGRKGDRARVSGGFVALPWAVLDCPAYARLSHPARSLLVEIARQYVRDNNGRLLASLAYLAKRGWRSADVITRAKRELIEAGFIHATVKGHRPNKASWHAVTWYLLDPHPGYDPGAAATFERGRYERQGAAQNAVFRPSHGIERPAIAPWDGIEDRPPIPPDGAIKALLTPPSIPSDGNHLEKPSAVGLNGDAVAAEEADNTDDPAPEFSRERDGDADRGRFNPITGEFDPPHEPCKQLAKQAASALVAAGLDAIKARRGKAARRS